MKQTIKLNEGELKHLISEIIQEAFKSKKLTSFAKQHGGLTNGNWSQSFGNDLYNMSDEEFDQYHTTDKDQHYRQYGIGGFNNPEDYDNLSFKPMEFNDGTFMVKKPSHEYDEREKALRQKREDRYNSRGRRGDKNYQYVNPYLNKLINNDHPDQYTHHEPRGNWGFPGEGEMTKTQLNPRAIKQNHIFSTYDGNEKWDMERDLENGNYEENNLDKNIVGKAYQSRPKQMNEEVLRRIISKILKETTRNVRRIRITALADMGRNKEIIMNNILMLRHARNVGDEENVNNTVLSALRRNSNIIEFEIVE